jgi:hypothetical protein
MSWYDYIDNQSVNDLNLITFILFDKIKYEILVDFCKFQVQKTLKEI